MSEHIQEWWEAWAQKNKDFDRGWDAGYGRGQLDLAEELELLLLDPALRFGYGGQQLQNLVNHVRKTYGEEPK